MCVCVCVSLPMAERWDEVQAAVDPIILDVLSVQSTLIPEILLKLLIYVVCDRLPTGTHTETHTDTLAAPPGSMSPAGARQRSRSSSSPLIVVDGVSEPRRVHDGQLELHALLLDVYSVLDDLHCLTNTLCKAPTERWR